MTTFTIEPENNITAFASVKEARASHIEQAEYFSSQEDLGKLAVTWPAARLIEIWNSLAGVTPVKKFTSRGTAVSRIWQAIQSLQSPEPAKPANSAQRAGKAANETPRAAHRGTRAKNAPKARDGSKKAEVLGLLRRPQGATLGEIITATGWQPHTVRGFISITGKKLGISVESTRTENKERHYRVTA